MQQKSGLEILEIEITNRCNLACKHCYVDSFSQHDLASEKIFELIDQCKEMGVSRLVFTGGEPLLASKIFDFVQYAKSKKIPQIALLTNGLLISENNINEIRNFDIVQLSIDVPPGGKSKIRENYLLELEDRINLLISKEIRIILQATLHKSLLPVLEKLGEFARSKKAFIGFNRLIPIGRATSLKNELLSPLQYKKALARIAKMRGKYGKFIRCSDPLLFLVDNNRRKYFDALRKKNRFRIIGGCVAGIAALYIDANGQVFPCAFLRQSIANIFKENLKNVWFNNEIIENFRDRDRFLGKCSSCRFLYNCGGCRTCAFIETGDFHSPDPYCWL